MHPKFEDRLAQVHATREAEILEAIMQAITSLDRCERALINVGAADSWSAGQDFLARTVRIRHQMTDWLTDGVSHEVALSLLAESKGLTTDMRAEYMRMALKS